MSWKLFKFDRKGHLPADPSVSVRLAPAWKNWNRAWFPRRT